MQYDLSFFGLYINQVSDSYGIFIEVCDRVKPTKEYHFLDPATAMSGSLLLKLKVFDSSEVMQRYNGV